MILGLLGVVIFALIVLGGLINLVRNIGSLGGCDYIRSPEEEEDFQARVQEMLANDPEVQARRAYIRELEKGLPLQVIEGGRSTIKD